MTEQGLHIAMFTPWRARCGISDYSRNLVVATESRDDVSAVRIVDAPEDAARDGLLNALRSHAANEARFRVLGEQMNSDGPTVAHVQHQYFFFGGVAPYRNHARAFLSAVRVPLVMTVHEIADPERSSSFVKRWALGITNRANFLHPAIGRLIVHTYLDRQRLVALGVTAERINVIPVGVPSAEPMPDSGTAKQDLGLTGRRVVTLFGFLSAKKGHRLAIEALKHLPDDVILLFAGSRHPDDHTDYVERLRAFAEESGLAERVRITGYLPEAQIPVVMAATDVAVTPFIQSSGSASLAHLFAYGRAIVASDIAPHREIIANEGECLALFRSEDASELAAAVRNVLDDLPRREKLQAAALRYAERHSYDKVATATVEIYKRIVQTF